MTKGTQNTPMTVSLKLDLFDKVAKQQGWKSHGDIAQAIGVSRHQVKRVLDGEQPPSINFVAGFLNAVPEAGFRRTFDIVPATDKEGTP